VTTAMSWMATVDGATKVKGATGVARAMVLEEGGVHCYQTMGAVTVELPMGKVFEIHRQQTLYRVLQVAQCGRAGRLLLVAAADKSSCSWKASSISLSSPDMFSPHSCPPPSNS
jgi:hypothetical protein